MLLDAKQREYSCFGEVGGDGLAHFVSLDATVGGPFWWHGCSLNGYYGNSFCGGYLVARR